MNLEAFLHNLHFDIDKTRPPDLEVDWEDGPLPYKLYRDLPSVPLCSEIPLTLEERKAGVKPDLQEAGHFLWYVYGLARVSQTVFIPDVMDHSQSLMQSYRRFAPSGGALYPSELYVYLKIEDLPEGVYHYDAAHHRLVLLRQGNYDSYLARMLGDRCDASACFGFVFVSIMFWKNFFKYDNFAYRLQGLDAGVLLGQLLEVAKRFGFAAGVYFQFLDRAANHLLGISEREESVYAVVPLSMRPAAEWFAIGNDGGAAISSSDLCGELAALEHRHYLRSRRIREYPLLLKMNEASMQKSAVEFRRMNNEKKIVFEGQEIALPQVKPLSYDLASACRMRYSPAMDFIMGKASAAQLAGLLRETMDSFAYRNDLDGVQAGLWPRPRVSLHVCSYSVEGIPDGAYRYDYAAHTLRRVRPGHQRALLQHGMSLDNVNLFQVPFCFHVAGDKDHLRTEMGFRGYRIQQMEAGMLVQRLLLTASAIGMGGHPLLGFDAGSCDEVYRLAPLGETSLIQIPAGPYRTHYRLEGDLHG